jgi:RHS repeat-associated protein
VLTARDNGTDIPEILGMNYYSPFGRKMHVNIDQQQITYNPKDGKRLGFITKEYDRESALADHGVRKYDYNIGRFTSTDPLFEKYAGWTPYQYSGNIIRIL